MQKVYLRSNDSYNASFSDFIWLSFLLSSDADAQTFENHVEGGILLVEGWSECGCAGWFSQATTVSFCSLAIPTVHDLLL